MTPLQQLYRTADRQGIRVFYFPMRHAAALSTPDDCIGMDVDKLADSAEELVCLAHEMGHCATGSFYTAESDLTQRRRCEERADRWAIVRLIPLRELKAALRRGMTRTDELAEYFQVPEDFIRKSLTYYHQAKNQL